MKRNIVELYHKQSIMLKPLVVEIKRSIKKGDSVLDLGCGSGIYINLIKKQVGNQGSVIAVDKDNKMIQFCRKKFHKSNIFFKISDAEKLSALNKKFDVIFASLILQFTNPKKSISEIRKILKQGGKLVFIIPLYRAGLSIGTNKISRKFKSEFEQNFALALKNQKASGFENKFHFEYPNSRADIFRHALKKNKFRIITWKVLALEKSDLKGILEYYKIPWRSERIVGLPFATRYRILSNALKKTFNKYPKFRIERFYLIATAIKNE